VFHSVGGTWIQPIIGADRRESYQEDLSLILMDVPVLSPSGRQGHVRTLTFAHTHQRRVAPRALHLDFSVVREPHPLRAVSVMSAGRPVGVACAMVAAAVRAAARRRPGDLWGSIRERRDARPFFVTLENPQFDASLCRLNVHDPTR
jgi:hypothetical protein